MSRVEDSIQRHHSGLAGAKMLSTDCKQIPNVINENNFPNKVNKNRSWVQLFSTYHITKVIRALSPVRAHYDFITLLYQSFFCLSYTVPLLTLDTTQTYRYSTLATF